MMVWEDEFQWICSGSILAFKGATVVFLGVNQTS